jgi:Ferric reductase like transmembrane component
MRSSRLDATPAAFQVQLSNSGQIYHRWASYMMFILALIHTFPYIIYHEHKGDIAQEWKTSVVYWTGVVALLAQAWLTLAALGPIRRRWYEFFKSTHLIAVVIFVIFFFLHCDFRLSSWYDKLLAQRSREYSDTFV